jgi:hypothetical protein
MKVAERACRVIRSRAQITVIRRQCPGIAICLAALALVTACSAAGARHAPTPVVLRPGAPAHTQPFQTAGSGEAIVDVTASAPGVSWEQTGRESAVAALSVDGRYMTDVVVPSSDYLTRAFALGAVAEGKHTLSVVFVADRSSPAATEIRVSALTVRVVQASDPAYIAVSHAPVVIGRALPTLGGPFQNGRTDTPLLAWHEETAAAPPGHRVLEYSLIWSNEDGGTDTPALMARWGRTTDIEWIYRVEVDQGGVAVPGTAVYQAANHDTLPFRGRYENRHPVLETCTANNNMCDQADGPMRLFLSAERTRPAGRAREVLMDDNPWTYQLMAQEMVREGKVEHPSNPATPGMGDQRTYLYVELGKHTNGVQAPSDATPRVSLGIQLTGNPTVYRSDHLIPNWTAAADDPATATAVELPSGTTPAQVARIIAIRQPYLGDDGSTITVTNIYRGFFLDAAYRPSPSFLTWSGSVTLSAQHPQATLAQ